MTTTFQVLGTLLLSTCVGATALAQTAAPPSQPGQLTIERVEQGFVFAPDARVTEVLLSQLGRAKTAKAREAAAPVYQRLIAGIEEAEFNMLLNLLNRLHANLRE